jgi:hypothetical protein
MPSVILLTRGLSTIVDDEDYPSLSLHRWLAHDGGSQKFYAARGKNVGNDKILTIRMHRVLLQAKPGEIVDHINGDTLDNRRANLRIVDRQGNKVNSARRKDSRQPYKGVRFEPHANKWAARICVMGRRMRLGLFATAEEAAIAFSEASLAHHGQLARLNVIKQEDK